MDKYIVQIPRPILDQVKSIKNYISDILQSPLTAEKRSRAIIKDLRSLEFFPQRGFDADEKVGRQIASQVKTRGILVADKKYMVFYTIDEEKKLVKVSHLFSTKSDCAKLFL